MNRRLFITRALAGLATVPLIGKLVNRPTEPKARYPYIERISWGPVNSVEHVSIDGRQVWPSEHVSSGCLAEPPLVFDRVLTEEEIAAIHDYYSKKYGIPVQDVRITKLS